MRNSPRRTATKIRNGRVQKKNRHALSEHYSQVRQSSVVIDRLKPGAGFKHWLTIADVEKFVRILPDWDQLSIGLDAIILDEADGELMGWHYDGVVAVCAWERDTVLSWDKDFFEEHVEILERLNVKYEADPKHSGYRLCYFDEASIKGFQLMHILLHELGHHHDRMTTRSQAGSARGEWYAENYALRYADRLWDAFFQAFPQ